MRGGAAIRTPRAGASVGMDPEGWKRLRHAAHAHGVMLYRSDPRDGPVSFFTWYCGRLSFHSGETLVRAYLKGLE